MVQGKNRFPRGDWMAAACPERGGGTCGERALVKTTLGDTRAGAKCSRGKIGPRAGIGWRPPVPTVAGEPEAKVPLYKPFEPHPALLPPPVPAVRKCHDAPFRLAGP